MSRYSISELRIGKIEQYEVIGYRLGVQGMKYDFSCELLSDFATEIVGYGSNYILGEPIYGEVVNGIYLTENEKNAVEVSSIEEISCILSEGVSWDNSPDAFLNGMLVSRFLVCKQMLYDIGLYLGNVTKVELSSRLSSAWGKCRRTIQRVGATRSPIYGIVIARRLLDGCQDFDSLDMVMIHELLHTIQGAFNHGTIWKNAAGRVGLAHGYDIQRLSDAEELGVSNEELIAQGYHACQCVNCGNIQVNKTECNFILHPENYCCGACGGKFIRIA